jgi:hypothetical protein
MRVKCVTNKAALLPKDYARNLGGYDLSTEFALIPGKEYLVYAIILYSRYSPYPWYQLCDETHSYRSNQNPAQLFEITDPKISRYWVYSFGKDTTADGFHMKLTFREWAFNPYYEDELLEGEGEALPIFRRYKELMDLEFPDPSVLETSADLGKNWVMCPFCEESWEANTTDGMVRCPNCKKLSHNPNYKE